MSLIECSWFFFLNCLKGLFFGMIESKCLNHALLWQTVRKADFLEFEKIMLGKILRLPVWKNIYCGAFRKSRLNFLGGTNIRLLCLFILNFLHECSSIFEISYRNLNFKSFSWWIYFISEHPKWRKWVISAQSNWLRFHFPFLVAAALLMKPSGHPSLCTLDLLNNFSNCLATTCLLLRSAEQQQRSYLRRHVVAIFPTHIQKYTSCCYHVLLNSHLRYPSVTLRYYVTPGSDARVSVYPGSPILIWRCPWFNLNKAHIPDPPPPSVIVLHERTLCCAFSCCRLFKVVKVRSII